MRSKNGGGGVPLVYVSYYCPFPLASNSDTQKREVSYQGGSYFWALQTVSSFSDTNQPVMVKSGKMQ